VSEAPLVVGDLLNLVDGSLCGAGQAVAFGLPASVVRVIWAAGGLGQDCDVRPVAMPSGYSWTPTPGAMDIRERGKRSVPPSPAGIHLVGGQAQRPLLVSDRGGAAVVLGGQESWPRGEGRQRGGQSG